MKVLITPRGFAKYGLNEIKMMEEKGIEVHYNNTGEPYSPETFVNLAKDADAIIVGVDLMNAAMMRQCPALKVICKFGVGTDNIDLEYAKQNNIHVGRTVGTNALAVAEHVIAMMFMQAKNLYATVHDVKTNGWAKPTGYEISGKTIGIIGFGAIGKHVANMANGLGMQVQAYDVFEVSDAIAKEHNTNIVALDDLIETSDYISLHVPLTPNTENMFDTQAFKAMKKSSVIINAARGGVVNEADLYTALVNQDIRAACFDVFSNEPPASDDKLIGLDNFFLTPHTASRTDESETRTCALSSKIIMEVLNV